MALPHLILLPGLGADRRFLTRQLIAFPDAIIPPWLPPEKHESLAHYSERMAAHIRPQLDGPSVVAGVSLGGMVALEMARHLGAKSAVLISSCREPGAVNRLLRMSELFARAVPQRVISWSLPLAPLILGRGFNLPPEDRRLLTMMVQETPLSFVKWGSRAVLGWPGLIDAGVPVRSIHGSKDWVIPPVRAKPDVLVPGGPHVLNISHPREVNEFLRSALAQA